MVLLQRCRTDSTNRVSGNNVFTSVVMPVICWYTGIQPPSLFSKTKSLQSSLTTELQNTIIATSSQDILEKITMEQSPEAALFDARKWSIDRLNKAVTVGEKDAIYKEFEEWIEVEPDDEDLEVLYLENLSEYYKEGG